MSAESALILLAVVVICGPAVVVGILFAVAYFTASRRVDAILSEVREMRGAAAERSDPEESFDLHADRVLDIVDDSPLIREIQAAISLDRDGVDIYKSAPKEMAP